PRRAPPLTVPGPALTPPSSTPRPGCRPGPSSFFFQAEDGIRDFHVTGVQTCALPIYDPGVGKRYDCGGREVTEVVVNVFRVEGGSLRCFSYVKGQLPNQSVALVSGIDRLQVLYGVSTQGDLDSANQYVSADRVADWGMVRAVRLAVLANSERAVNPPPPPRDYILLDAAPVSFDDRLARQIYTTTIQLRNIQ